MTTPSVTVNVVDTALDKTDNISSVVTFEFSESVMLFDETDLSVIPIGAVAISGFTIIDGDSYSAIITVGDLGSYVDLIGVQVIVNASYTDLAGDPGLSGMDTVDIIRDYEYINSAITVNTTLVTNNIIFGPMGSVDNDIFLSIPSVASLDVTGKQVSIIDTGTGNGFIGNATTGIGIREI